MIDIVSGLVVRHDKDYVVMMVGGIGLRILVPKTVLELIKGPDTPLLIYTHLAVREDALTLYGFASEEERSIFELVISVSGIGPKIGLAILSTMSLDLLRRAVGREDPVLLTRVPGIGKKLAEKIVFELKGKLDTGPMAGLALISDADAEVMQALTSLGYSVVEAQTAIQAIPRDTPKDTEARIMAALQYFA